MLQQTYNDRKYQAAHGRGRLSLAPVLTRSYGGEVIEERSPPRPQFMYREVHGDKGNAKEVVRWLALTGIQTNRSPLRISFVGNLVCAFVSSYQMT